MSEHIDPDNIPKAYGGNFDWDFGDKPSLDPYIVESFDMKEVPIGPVAMRGNQVVALGKSQGNPRREVVGHLRDTGP